MTAVLIASDTMNRSSVNKVITRQHQVVNRSIN